MSARRAWTEAQARAWLKASLPKGWRFSVVLNVPPVMDLGAFYVGAECSGVRAYTNKPTLRAACLALVRAAKRAGINVTAAPEPQQGGK